MNNSTMGDKEMMNDILASQKLITSTYNTYANECSTPCVRDDFLNILKEEHDMQYDVFNEISGRGWYQTQPAEQNKIMQAKQKIMNSNT